MDHNGPLRIALVYHNTFYTGGRAIRLSSRPRDKVWIAGNLMLMDSAISGHVPPTGLNTADRPANAADYFRAPSLRLGEMDLHPVPGRARGEPVKTGPVAHLTDHDRDFDGRPRGDSGFRGCSHVHAFSDLGTNCVILISRDRDRGQNTDNRYHDHQFDEGKTVLHLSHCEELL